MDNGFRIKTKLPVEPKAVYQAWLSGTEHSAMTGSKATASDKVGDRFTAWNGYIRGKNLELKPHWCIVQSWRTTQFSDNDPDSRLEICIHPSGNGSELLLIHTDIPPAQIAGYQSGWTEYYFAPMKTYFAARKPAKTAARKTAKRVTKKKAAGKKSARKRPAKRRARR